jgi:hypothetical protein
MGQKPIRFPKTGMFKDDVLFEMAAFEVDDVQWRAGKTFGLVLPDHARATCPYTAIVIQAAIHEDGFR